MTGSVAYNVVLGSFSAEHPMPSALHCGLMLAATCTTPSPRVSAVAYRRDAIGSCIARNKWLLTKLPTITAKAWTPDVRELRVFTMTRSGR